MRRRIAYAALMTGLLGAGLLGAGLLVVPAAAADPAPATTADLAAALKGDALNAASMTLLTLLFLAVLLESALAILFNWRPFVETFNARATRPLVAFVVALITVLAYDYDAITALMGAVNNKTGLEVRLFGQILTAAILAGGSSGVNTVLVSLGFREVKTPATVTPKVPPDHAWVSVQVEQSPPTADRSRLHVHIGPPDATNQSDAAKVRLAGTIGLWKESRLKGIARFFLRPPGRFPAFGGHAVKASEACTVALSSRTNDGTLKVLNSVTFTPAPGAIIDLNLPIS